MTIQTLANALVVLLLVGWIGVRQLTWRPVTVSKMWRLPLILAAIGVVQLVGVSHGSALSQADVAVLIIELVVSLGVGSAMGVLARFRPATAGEPSNPSAPAEFESRTGWLGLALWLVFIAVRVGIDFWAVSAGSVVATATGVIFVMIAANRASRTAVFTVRLSRMTPVAA
ncbi:hypothetical protein ACVXZ4_05975 [Lacisediminihabitans sp. FW035]